MFEVEHADVSFYKNELGYKVVCIEGSGEKGAQAILCGDLADQHSGNPAPITTLWRHSKRQYRLSGSGAS